MFSETGGCLADSGRKYPTGFHTYLVNLAYVLKVSENPLGFNLDICSKKAFTQAHTKKLKE